MLNIKRILLISLVLQSFMSASTMFTLAGINKVYPVIEISSKSMPKEYKKVIADEIQSTTDKLKLDTSGYSSTSLAMLINETRVGTISLINIRLVVGEQVKRLGSTQITFAITYEATDRFTFDDTEDLEDKLEDSVDNLLTKFSEQYSEENKPFDNVTLAKTDFASLMNYDTNYDKALVKAKELRKNVMLILVANYCPWCRKFEQRVLSQKTTNEIIQNKYIPLILNKEKDKFPKQFRSSFTPVVYFIDYKTLKTYKTVVGYNNKDEFSYFIKSDDSKK